jgi:hypothetical protein
MNDKLKANFLPDKPWLESDYREILQHQGSRSPYWTRE